MEAMPDPSPQSSVSEASTACDFSLDPQDGDYDTLEAWMQFLTAYASGTADANPMRPPLPPRLQKRIDSVTYQPREWPYADAPLYSSTTIDPEVASKIREFYCDYGYLPAPRAPLESQRKYCIREYDLYAEKQMASIQQATDLLAAVFPKTLVTFSLFQDRIQTHFALSGPDDLIQHYKLTRGLRVPSEDSLCSHAVLLDQKMLYIPDLQADWRFQLNPFAMAGFQSFVGFPVSLELDPLLAEQRHLETSTENWPTLHETTSAKSCRTGVGTLNICFIKEPQTELTDGQRLVITRVGSMLESQLRASWEEDQRVRDNRARSALTEYIEEALVENAGQNPDPLGSLGTSPEGISADRVALQRLAESAARKIASIVDDADSVSVWDLRAVSQIFNRARVTSEMVAETSIVLKMVRRGTVF